MGIIPYIDSKKNTIMAEQEGVTRITLQIGEKEIAVEMPGSNLVYTEFMELIEMVITNSGYSEHEIESYILQWGKDIKAKNSN